MGERKYATSGTTPQKRGTIDDSKINQHFFPTLPYYSVHTHVYIYIHTHTLSLSHTHTHTHGIPGIQCFRCLFRTRTVEDKNNVSFFFRRTVVSNTLCTVSILRCVVHVHCI